MNDIWQRRGDLERERRDFMRSAMAGFDVDWRQRMNALRDECGATTGHCWRFSHFGPLGASWSFCSLCGQSKVEQND